MKKAVIVAVGYGLFLALITGSRVTSLSGSDSLFSSSVSLCMAATCAACLIIGFASLLNVDKARRIAFIGFFALCAISFILDAAGAWILPTGVGMGFGLGCGYVVWGDMLARCTKKQIMVVPLFMTVFWGIAGAFLTSIDNYQFRMIPMTIFLAGSCVLYIALEKGCVAQSDGDDSKADSSNFPEDELKGVSSPLPLRVAKSLLLVIWQPMLLTGVLGFSSGILRALTAMQGTDPIVLSVARFSCAAFVVLLFLLWSKKSIAFETSPIALVLLLVTASAFIFLPFSSSYYRVALASIVDISYLLSGVFLSISCAMASRHVENSTMLSCGMGQGLSSVLVTMGFSISTYLNLNPLSDSFGEWALALGVVYWLFVIAIVLSVVRVKSKEGDDSRSPSIQMVISVSEDAVRKNATLNETYHITRREMDVLVLALTGRNAASIAESLFLSESTVRTHLKHIYRKLGIHSKEELHHLVEGLVVKSP